MPINVIAQSSTLLTDAAASQTFTKRTDDVDEIVVDFVCDKGSTLVITPLPDADDDTLLGLASDTLTIADGGGQVRGSFTCFAPSCKFVITKTEAGDATSTYFVANGRFV